MPSKKPKAPRVSKNKLKLSGKTRVSTNAETPVFSFQYLVDGKYSLSACEQREKAALADTLAKLSKLTWAEIVQSPRHGNGHEIIPTNQIQASIPSHITEDVRILAFRFYRNAPMVGYRADRIFYIIWLDRDFSLYDHG